MQFWVYRRFPRRASVALAVAALLPAAAGRAHAAGGSIFGYAPSCHGAEDYLALAMEVLGEPKPKVMSAKVQVGQLAASEK